MIVFKRVRWRNFLATGDEWTEIELNKAPTTLIVGANGAGKSTLLDALSFGLFGVPFRNINVPQLVNDTNENNMVVEIEFQINRTNYKVRRGLKPRIFEIFINNKMVDQDAKARDYQKYLEQNIIKLNKKSFTQVVVLGSAAFVPFMQLPASERRNIVEDLLDIEIFSSMNVVLKDKVNQMKDEYIGISNQIELQENKIELVQAYLSKIKSDNASSISEKKQTIAENENQRDRLDHDILELHEEIHQFTELISDKIKIKQRLKKLETAKDKLFGGKEKASKEKEFFIITDSCPTCKQNIDSTFKEDMVLQKTKVISEIETAINTLGTDLKNVENRLQEIADVMKIIDDREKKISKLTSSINGINTFIKKVQKDIDSLYEKGEDASEQENKFSVLSSELETLSKDRDKLTERKHYLDIIAVMLKDSGIKTKIIRQYLPIINKHVNKFLASMEFFANFTLDENFKDTIHVRGSKERTYYQLSEGQKLRINLAMLFSWREVAKSKNSANTNLLIMDEIFEKSLDAAGVDDLLRLIHTLSQNTNIFIISPQGDILVDKFSNTLRFVESQGFSIMEKE